MKRLFLFLLVLGVWVETAVSDTHAHAQLVETNPAPGSVLESSPATIELTYNEPVGPGSRLSLFDDNFYAVTGVRSNVNRENATQLIATLPPLEPGIYTVNWTAISGDGHPVSGSYRFQVSPPTTTDNRSAGVNLWYIALLLGGICLLVGLVWLGRRQLNT